MRQIKFLFNFVSWLSFTVIGSSLLGIGAKTFEDAALIFKSGRTLVPMSNWECQGLGFIMDLMAIICVIFFCLFTLHCLNEIGKGFRTWRASHPSRNYQDAILYF